MQTETKKTRKVCKTCRHWLSRPQYIPMWNECSNLDVRKLVNNFSGVTNANFGCRLHKSKDEAAK